MTEIACHASCSIMDRGLTPCIYGYVLIVSNKSGFSEPSDVSYVRVPADGEEDQDSLH